MDQQHLLLLSFGVFLSIAAGGFGLWRLVGDNEARRLRQRLRALVPTEGEDTPLEESILQDTKLSGIPAFDALLRRLPFAGRLQLFLMQGDTPLRLGAFLLLALVLAALGAVVPAELFHAPMASAPSALLLGSLPFLWAKRRKTKRVIHFERLFPDALDILTGALRSGMALSGAIQVVSDECADPVAGEFRRVFEETRLGVDMRHALRHMASRVDSKELHLFVIAVLLQRETGGNLAEILDGTAAVIRERIRILGDVRALTAQARISGAILGILPIALAVFILATAPDYMRTLLKDQTGRYLLVGAAALQLVGYYFMRRIANIKV